jgi:hypothetical protein
MTENDALPAATVITTFRVYGVDVVCHALDDGRRMIEHKSLVALSKAMDGPCPAGVGDVEGLMRWRGGK